VVWEVVLLLVLVLTLVAPARVGVVMYPGVTSQLVWARELLAAAGELAGVRLLSSVRSNMAGLVLQAMEGLVAERTFVWPGQLVRRLRGLSARKRPIGLDDGHGRGSHIGVRLLWFLDILLSGNCGIE
jgi:hypothetical protein